MNVIYNAIAVFNVDDLNGKDIYFLENLDFEKVEKRFKNLKSYYEKVEKTNEEKIISLVKIEHENGQKRIVQTYESFAITDRNLFIGENVLGRKMKILRAELGKFLNEKRTIEKTISNFNNKIKNLKIRKLKEKFEIKIKKIDKNNPGSKKNNYIPNRLNLNKIF